MGTKTPASRTRGTRLGALVLGLAAAAGATAATAAGVSAQSAATLATAAPEDVGLSSEILAEIEPAVQEFLDAGRTGGVLTLVARRGEIVHWAAQGWRVLNEDRLEPTDIFRIYSMTKPVTSVAAMILVEEGRLSLDDAVAKHVPAFAEVRVYDGGTLRAPTRPMLVRDLLSHTSGLTYGIFGNSPVDSLYLSRVNPLSTHSNRSLAETVDIIASLPLIDDPGARWNYSMSTDVLGRVVEVASGMSLDDFFRTRIFEPLGMEDTGFHVPPEKSDRFVALYGRDAGGLRLVDSPEDGLFTRPPSWYSGGGGLTSTAPDYFRFSQMLLNGGELDGVRILSPQTVGEMSRNQLPPELLPLGPIWPDTGFGLGFAVSLTEHAGNYFWLGVANTYFWIDPTEELVVFAWTQFEPVMQAPVDRLLRPIVYRSITGEQPR